MKTFLISMDCGQFQDPAAIQVYRARPIIYAAEPYLEAPQRIIIKDDLIAQYQFVDKRYTKLGEFIWDLMNIKELYSQTVLTFDCTGVGQAVKDILYEKGVKDMIPISYTGGGKANPVYRDSQDRRFSGGDSLDFHILDQYNVPKADLIEAARIELEQNNVCIMNGVPFKDAFEKQLMHFKGQMTPRGYMKTGNDAEGEHDEWVDCFFMRCWVRRQTRFVIEKEQDNLSRPQQQFADIISV